MLLRYFAAGGLRIDYLISHDGQVHLREMGGNAIYAAVGARIWSEDVGILSRVGENYPSEWLARLEDAGICTAGVRRVSGAHEMRTFYAYTSAEHRDDTEPAVHFGRLGLPLPDDLKGYVHSTPGQDGTELLPVSPRPEDLPVSYMQARAAHLSPLDMPAHRALSADLVRRGLPFGLDPGERYMRPGLGAAVRSLLGSVRLFLPSEQEVTSLLGAVEPRKAVRLLSEAGPSVVVIKAGSRGSLVYERATDRLWSIPAYATEVVDVTGAGDAFCGGYMVGYDETRDPVLAACYGAASASLVLEGFGALHALGHTRADAEARVGELRRLACALA